MKLSKTNSDNSLSRMISNPSNAKKYIETYYKNYNPKYPDWSSRTNYKTYTSNPYSASGNASTGDAVSLLNSNGLAIHTMVVYEVKYVGSSLEMPK